eukprot:1155366-Pelagomonas_calceolata.AAC.1
MAQEVHTANKHDPTLRKAAIVGLPITHCISRMVDDRENEMLVLCGTNMQDFSNVYRQNNPKSWEY